tara:strand:+ start:452 stop:712 length:261 start_codon:yes stop_codon:yes gene_type:complete
MNRVELLDFTSGLISGARQADYGSPAEHFAAVAAVWSVLLGHPVTPVQVPLLMAALKLVRASHNHTHLDNWIDLAGYAALAGEIST